MSSVIGGMEDTIAQTMAEIGWPGADLVNERDDAPAVEIEAEDPVEDLGAADDSAADDSVGDSLDGEDSPEDADETASKAEPAPAEPAYRPKWKKAALAELDKLPPEVQQAFIAEDKRREENFHKGIEQYRTGHTAAKEWDEVITPYRATIDQFQVKPQEAVKQLLATDHVLRYGQPQQKIGTILQVMQGYGINPADLAAIVQENTQQQPQDPQYQALNQRLAQFEQAQFAQQQAAEQARQKAEREQQTVVQSEIEKFASDPDHEHFDLLRPLMGGYLQNGVAKDMAEAYDMAMRAHPQTAQIWIAQQQKQWADSRKAAAQKAKTVTNVRSNGRASTAKPTAGATMEDTIRQTAERLGLA